MGRFFFCLEYFRNYRNTSYFPLWLITCQDNMMSELRRKWTSNIKKMMKQHGWKLKESRSLVEFDKLDWTDLPQTLNNKNVVLAFPKHVILLSKNEKAQKLECSSAFRHPQRNLRCLWGIQRKTKTNFFFFFFCHIWQYRRDNWGVVFFFLLNSRQTREEAGSSGQEPWPPLGCPSPAALPGLPPASDGN